MAAMTAVAESAETVPSDQVLPRQLHRVPPFAADVFVALVPLILILYQMAALPADQLGVHGRLGPILVILPTTGLLLLRRAGGRC
jgi:hypothetical protein